MNLLDLARSALANRPDTGAMPGAGSRRHRRWSVAFPNLDPVEVIFTPEATRAEVAAVYPGAKIEALSDPPRRTATPAEAAELQTLVRVVLADAPQEWDEVTAIALADPEAALVSFRLLAADARERAIWGG